MKQGLLHDLLSRGLDDNGELRDPERHPEQFKDSPLGLVPQDWSVASLARWLNGSPKNGYSPVAVDENTGVLMLGLGCLTPFGFEPKQLKNAPRNDLKVDEAKPAHFWAFEPSRWARPIDVDPIRTYVRGALPILRATAIPNDTRRRRSTEVTP